MVAPTWRIAEMRAEPAPLPCAEGAPSAAFMAAVMANPSPSPAAANQDAAKTVPLRVLVVAPTASATAITAKPTVTRARTPTPGAARGDGHHGEAALHRGRDASPGTGGRCASGAFGRGLQPGADEHAEHHPAD